MIEWRAFLFRWSRELLKTELRERVAPPLESEDWLGFEPADEAVLANLEKRLGLTLPPSYRGFLLTTNGWRRTTTFIGRMRPAQEVNWYRVENESSVEIWSASGSSLPDEEYYKYEEGGAPDYRAKHVHGLLQISDVEDGVYLLNPQAVTPDGEWEAWFLASWIPGAVRFPSFAHLMLREYRSFARLSNVDVSERALPTLEMPPPTAPRAPATRVGKPKKAPTMAALINQMGEAKGKELEKVVRTFFGKLKLRAMADRRPELVEPLVELFRRSDDAGVRAACVAGLTEVAEDGNAPPVLLEALSDPDPGVILQGMFALHYFPNDRALQPLCAFIESGANVLFNETAMSLLGKMKDERAVPTLIKVLLNTGNRFDQSFGTAGLALGQCGAPGFNALVSALGHEDVRVRRAAVVGLDCCGDSRAAAYLDEMEKDPDEWVRKRAKVRLGSRFTF